MESKRVINNLGKTNQKLLKDEFGFKTIRQAKKSFGVDTNLQAYEVMQELHNDIILEEQKATKNLRQKQQKEIKKTKQKFKSILNELKQNKISYTVAITINEKTIYKKTNESYITTLTIQETYRARNEAELTNMINDTVTLRYPFEESSSVIYLESYNYKISENKKLKVHKLDVPMKRASPFKTSFLKYYDNIDNVSYEDHEGECVLKTLMKYMDIKKEKTMINYFNNASKLLYKKPYNKEEGITSRMILQICDEKNISCLGFDQQNNNFVKHTADQTKKRKFRPIIFYCFMSHFYIITNKDIVLSISAAFRQNNNVFHSTLEIVEEKKENKEVKFYSNITIAECLELEPHSVVIYNKSSVLDELQEYIKLTNDIPKIKNHTITLISSFTTNNKVDIVISGCLNDVGFTWQKVQEICKKADIPFDNQSIGGLLIQLKDKFFIPKREKFTNEQRENIAKEQYLKCIMCDDELSKKFHIDHIQPISNGGTNKRDNLQALCQSCHIDKSREEKESCEYVQGDQITSAFNMQSYDVLNSDFFRKCAFTQRLGEEHFDDYPIENLHSKDMNKCRRNILINYKNDFPRYSVLDEIEDFDGILTTGFYYIESENVFPLRKNGFYSKPMVDYCLEQNIITNDNIIYQFKSSFETKNDYFKDFIHQLDKIIDDKQLSKLAVNSFVGLFGRRKNTFIENRICSKNATEEIASAYEDFHKPYLNIINEDVVQIAGQSEIKKIESSFPIHAQIVDCEAIELHKLCIKIKEFGGIPIEVKTDAVNYYCDEQLVFNEHWDTDKKLEKYKDEEAKAVIRHIFIKNDKQFKLKKHSYNRYEEEDDFKILAQKIIDSNQGCKITAPGGCGKTYLINEIKKILGDKKIKCLAPTNKACLLIGGQTLHKFSYALLNSKSMLKKYKNIDYIFVDEISMVQEIFYQVLLILKNYNPNLKIIMVGDYGQLPPVNDRVKKNYENTRCLFELVDGNSLELTKCKRSDDTHFNTCMQVRNGENININKFKCLTATPLNLCHTNELRKEINEAWMDETIKKCKTKTLSYEALKYDKNTQNITICKDMPIIARINNKGLDVVNNECFSIDEINNDVVSISNEIKTLKIPSKNFNRLFNLAYCITIHKSQGATFNGKYTIYEWEKLTRKLKYVAISRATCETNVQINN